MEELFGKGFSDGLFGSLIGAIIGSITTGIFFYLGIRTERKKNEKIKHDEETDMLKYFSSLISSIISTAKERAILYNIHSESLSKDPYKVHSLILIPDADLSRALDKLEHKRIFHAYMNLYEHKDKVGEFKRIFIALDTIDNVLNTSQEVHLKYFTNNSIEISKFNDIAEKLIDNCITTVENIEKKSELPQFNGLLVFLRETLDEFYANAENPIKKDYINEKLIKPIQINLGGILVNFEEAIPLLNQSREASLVLYNVIGLSQDTSHQFGQFHKNLLEAILDLESNTSNLVKRFNSN